MPALIVGANLPDVDAACFIWLDGAQHLGFRRGITHGPLAWVLLPLLLAGALWWFDRWQARRGTRPEGRLPVRFGWLYALSFIACLSHPALDWLNSYGVRLLEPFSSRWFYGDTLFIIDVWLWLGMSFATWLSLRRERRGQGWRTPARIALAAAFFYVATNYGVTRWVESVQPAQPAIASPLPLAFWEREVIVPDGPGRWRIDGEPVGECALGPARAAGGGNPELAAFLLWSRAPFAERARDGSMIVFDARFYDPRARDRFSVALPGVVCEPLS